MKTKSETEFFITRGIWTQKQGVVIILTTHGVSVIVSEWRGFDLFLELDPTSRPLQRIRNYMMSGQQALKPARLKRSTFGHHRFFKSVSKGPIALTLPIGEVDSAALPTRFP
jgi:hypothetical protein